MSSGKATLHELQTVYGLRDAYAILEVLAVDGHNARAFQAAAKVKNAS